MQKSQFGVFDRLTGVPMCRWLKLETIRSKLILLMFVAKSSGDCLGQLGGVPSFNSRIFKAFHEPQYTRAAIQRKSSHRP